MTRGVCERKCTYCETWTRGWIAVCSDCHGERTDALCRRKRAERQVAAVEKVVAEWADSLGDDGLHPVARSCAESCLQEIRRAMEVE